MQIKELQLFTSDLPATLEFYRDTLLLPVMEKDNSCTIYLPQSILRFQQADDLHPVYHVALNIPSNQAADALRWLHGKAEPLILPDGHLIADFRNWNAESVYFLDNNGNIMELIARRDLNNPSGEDFTGHSILSVSEFGLVTDNVRTTCSQLLEQFGIGFFSKQPPMEHFAAVGDDQGLFIVVSQNRNWYPTGIPAAFYHFRIIFGSGGKDYILENGIS